MKIISAAQAASLIKDGSTVGVGGLGGWGCPDGLLRAIAKSYSEIQTPANLTMVAGVSPGTAQNPERGLNTLREPGLIGGIIAGHVGNPPAIRDAVGENKIPAYTIPLGVYNHLLRAMAGKKPGIITHVGLHTFADPRLDGCVANELAREQNKDLVKVVEVDGHEYLFYKTFPIDVCLLRGTYADEAGNISTEEEAIICEQREMATAVHNAGGIVIVQVKKIVANGSLNARNIQIHKSMVDYVVVAEDSDDHVQGFDDPTNFRPELLGDIKIPVSSLAPMPLNVRKVIGRRAAFELKPDVLVNLGIGMPDGVAAVAGEEGLSEGTTLSTESGTIGGVPVGGIGLGGSVNPEAVYTSPAIFDLYDGGGLDMAFLGVAQIDREGNVNVSKFSGRCTGPGGFIDITQNTPVVCFMGTFMAGKSKIEIADGKLNIIEDAKGIKFVEHVEQVTFSALYAHETGQKVLFVTERAVFELGEGGLTLTEIAPGVDLQRDILDKMDFEPLIAEDLKTMDERIFRPEKMGLMFSE